MGEFGLIDHLTKNIKLKNKSSLYGVGDDAAVISSGDNLTLVSTDLLVEGVHFDLSYIPLKHLGYKAAIVNFSDIYAMGGTPEQITVGMAVSNRYSLEAIDEIYDGLNMACDAYGVDLVGGDTTSSLSGLFLSITVIGRATEDELVYRNTAKEHDLLCVSGDLGAAYMGLQLLEREKSVFESDKGIQPDLSGNDYILERQLKPEARKDVIEALKKANVKPTSMIDISDGLSSDLLHITESSGIGASIYEEKLPIDPATAMTAEQFKIGAVTAALNGGEDYELLFTVDLKDHEKIAGIPSISVIGHMTGKNESCNLVTISNEIIPIKASGWKAFSEE